MSFIAGSSGTGTSEHELQNRYCGGVLSDTTDSALHDSIIGKYNGNLLFVSYIVESL